MTELITGVDLVQEQIKVAMGQKLSLKQEDVVMKVSSGLPLPEDVVRIGGLAIMVVRLGAAWTGRCSCLSGCCSRRLCPAPGSWTVQCPHAASCFVQGHRSMHACPPFYDS